MKDADPIAFGNRVRERREALGLSQERLGELSGYSQSNIGWIEGGGPKRLRGPAAAISEALRTTAEYLLWGTGPVEIGPPIMSEHEVVENYKALSPEDRAAVTALIAERADAAKEKRKTG